MCMSYNCSTVQHVLCSCTDTIHYAAQQHFVQILSPSLFLTAGETIRPLLSVQASRPKIIPDTEPAFGCETLEGCGYSHFV